jgi:hypothetical protein
MRRPKYRRASNDKWFSGRRRIIAVAATLVAFGGIVTVTQVSSASTNRDQKKALSACDRIAAPDAAKLSTKTHRGDYTTNNGTVTQHPDDGAGDTVTPAELRDRCRQWVMGHVGNHGGGGKPPATVPASAPGSAPASGGQSAPPVGATTAATTAAPAPSGTATVPPAGTGLDILTNSCDTSKLPPHTGFQDGGRCVSTEFGEVGSEKNNPSLLITAAPRQVAANTPFTLSVSTRNLIRDRFLAAGKGGYYVESSVLQNGLVRGHFHTACRMLDNTNEAPAPDPVPAFFVATEDSKGGATADTVQIQVPGLPAKGTAQCASWAGDGSHRIPMMQRANQIPSFDVVRIRVN